MLSFWEQGVWRFSLRGYDLMTAVDGHSWTGRILGYCGNDHGINIARCNVMCACVGDGAVGCCYLHNR